MLFTLSPKDPFYCIYHLSITQIYMHFNSSIHCPIRHLTHYPLPNIYAFKASIHCVIDTHFNSSIHCVIDTHFHASTHFLIDSHFNAAIHCLIYTHFNAAIHCLIYTHFNASIHYLIYTHFNASIHCLIYTHFNASIHCLIYTHFNASIHYLIDTYLYSFLPVALWFTCVVSCVPQELLVKTILSLKFVQSPSPNFSDLCTIDLDL